MWSLCRLTWRSMVRFKISMGVFAISVCLLHLWLRRSFWTFETSDKISISLTMWQRNLLTLLYLGLSIIKFQGAVTRPTRSSFPNMSCKNTTKVGMQKFFPETALSQRLKLPEGFKYVMILVLVTGQHPGSGKSKPPQIKVEIPIKTRGHLGSRSRYHGSPKNHGFF